MKILLVVILFLSQIASAKGDKNDSPGSTVLKSSPSQGQVNFEAVGKPSFLKIRGKGPGPEGEVKIDSAVHGTFKFKASSLETGISLRDTHMKEKYLQVERFPTIDLKIDSVENFNASSPEADGLIFKGTLTIHGVSKPVSGIVDIKKKDTGFSIKAQFETKISEHGIDLPSYSGITVADSVKVSVETNLL